MAAVPHDISYAAYADRIESALAALDLDTKARLLAGQDGWSLPAVPEIGLASLVMSDGPVGVRGVRWSPDDPSVLLPSPTALAATWDPELARTAGRLLAQEARRKGVHVLLAPTVNMHRTPVGGRHFECYSEDPLLTGAIGTDYVRGVQDGGVGTTVKHWVANDSETDRFTVDVRADARALREIYMAPFEHIVTEAAPWGIMSAYNRVNGPTMTEHDAYQNGVLRGEWGFDGYIVSDWTAARSTAGCANGGTDVAMPGPNTVYGEKLAAAVREGTVAEETVDAMVRRVLLLAARVGILDGAPPAVSGDRLPDRLDGAAVSRTIARRSFVLLRNEPGPDGTSALPLNSRDLRKVALIGAAADKARVLGGGSATVCPEHVISPVEGLRAALPENVELVYARGADPSTKLHPAAGNFSPRATIVGNDDEVLGTYPLTEAQVQWVGELPDGIDSSKLDHVELGGVYTPSVGGMHAFSLTGVGDFELTVGGTTLFRGKNVPPGDDPFVALSSAEELRFDIELNAGEQVEVRVRHVPLKMFDGPMVWVQFGLGHAEPSDSPDAELDQAVAAAAAADVAIVVVATTEDVESEGFDRETLELPGRQNELVARVAAVNPHTVVVVNAGSPVEMPWTDDVAAVLLTWFPGQECGAALADVLLGAHEPGGRLPTTWPARKEDSPVLRVTPTDGALAYEEGVFIGYRAWERTGAEPRYWFGHGLGYTTWEYVAADFVPSDDPDGELLGALTVDVRNTGHRPGREVVQAYLSAADQAPAHEADIERPVRWLVGFAPAEAGPGETVRVTIPVPRRAAEVWNADKGAWQLLPGQYAIEAGRSLADRRVQVTVPVHALRPAGEPMR
ncbi:beta-glucosidase [Streptomyces flavidovirens]|uniref:beta-glucosidase family protein n=1 Tax=Streptomyces flavidovirens TaxID=67298 RepID=UPI00368D5E5E